MYIAILATVAAAETISAILMLKFRDILHVIIAFSAFMTVNSAISLILQQPLLAILQLFIMVGGVATFAFVGAASAGTSKFGNTNPLAFVAVAIVMSALLMYSFSAINAPPGAHNVFSAQSALPYINQDLPLFYIITAMLFGVGFASIIVMRKGAGK